MFYSFNGSNRRGERTIELFSGGKIIKIFSPLIVICLTRSVKDWIKKLILSFPDLIVSIQRSLIREKIEWLFSYLAGRWVCDYKIGSAPHNWNISTLSRRLQLSCLRMSRSQGRTICSAQKNWESTIQCQLPYNLRPSHICYRIPLSSDL